MMTGGCSYLTLTDFIRDNLNLEPEGINNEFIPMNESRLGTSQATGRPLRSFIRGKSLYLISYLKTTFKLQSSYYRFVI